MEYGVVEIKLSSPKELDCVEKMLESEMTRECIRV